MPQNTVRKTHSGLPKAQNLHLIIDSVFYVSNAFVRIDVQFLNLHPGSNHLIRTNSLLCILSTFVNHRSWSLYNHEKLKKSFLKGFMDDCQRDLFQGRLLLFFGGGGGRWAGGWVGGGDVGVEGGGGDFQLVFTGIQERVEPGLKTVQ